MKLSTDIHEIEKELGHVSCNTHHYLGRKAATHFDGKSYSYGVREELEGQVGHKNKLNQTPEYFQHVSFRLNTCKKQQASRDGRQHFWRKFHKMLYYAFEVVDHIAPAELRIALDEAQRELYHWTSLDAALFES